MNLTQKIISKSINCYMRYMTKKELDFKYNDNISYPKFENKEYLLYIHIPFCKTMYPYCSFHKYMFKEENAKKYFINL